MIPRVAFIIEYVGDYHAPRLVELDRALRAAGGSLHVFQRRTASVFYAHEQSRAATLARNLHVTLAGRSRTPLGFLRATSPTHVVVLGYSNALALAALAYAKIYRRPIIFLSDSKADDQPRGRATEAIKSLLLKFFDGAVVAGARHQKYFEQLGFTGPIQTGYDVIDNEFFATQAKLQTLAHDFKRPDLALPDKYIICVSRLVERKRVSLAINIFHESGIAARGYKLVVVGDGPLRPELEAHAKALGVGSAVRFLGSIPNSLMPRCYSGAAVLVLASEYDQWGLCVNEAMAVGVPCIVSSRTGAANEIVLSGLNGVVFDEGQEEAAAESLANLVSDPQRRSDYSSAALRTIADWGLTRFANSVVKVVAQLS